MVHLGGRVTRHHGVSQLVPELRTAAAQLPPRNYDNLAAARQMVAAIQRYLPPVDTTGVTFDNRTVAASRGGLPIRADRPVGPALPRRPWSFRTGEASSSAISTPNTAVAFGCPGKPVWSWCRWTTDWLPEHLYPARLVGAGVDTEFHRLAGTIHSYDGLPISAGVITTVQASQHEFLERTLKPATAIEERADG